MRAHTIEPPRACAPDVTATFLVEQAFTLSLARRRTNEPAEDLHRIAHRRPCGGRRLVYEAARSWTGLPADGHAGAVGALRPGRANAFNQRRDRRQGRDVPCTSTMSRPSAAGCRAWGSCSGTTSRATTRRWRRCVILTAICSRWRRRPRGPIRRHDRSMAGLDVTLGMACKYLFDDVPRLSCLERIGSCHVGCDSQGLPECPTAAPEPRS